MISISNHALLRYGERVKGKNTEEVKAEFNDTKSLYSFEIEKMVLNGKLIYSGSFENPDKKERNFYLCGKYIVITNKTSENVITLYEVDFGFSKDINDTILKKLTEEVENQKNNITEEKEAIEKEMKEQQSELDNLKLEKSNIEDSLKAINISMDCLENYLKSLENSLKAKEELYLGSAKRICFSKQYKDSLMQ